MRITILHQMATSDSAVDEIDVLLQRDAVRDALERAGHDVDSLPCTLDLSSLHDTLLDRQTELVFNLVESLQGTDRLAPLIPLVLETLGIPFTGASSAAMLRCASKTETKRALRDAGIPTPDWVERSQNFVSGDNGTRFGSPRWIYKPIWEHASVGMLDDAVQTERDLACVRQSITTREDVTCSPMFAEAFIEGREFNLSLLERPGDPTPQVLPPAEIDFSHFPEHKPRIVGYRAKWDSQSFEYHHTPRQFQFPPRDLPLIQRLADCAVHCWNHLALTGYARIDFRVDQAERMWVLEANTNPCLSPDAGFAAALEHAGISFDQALAQIVAAAQARSSV